MAEQTEGAVAALLPSERTVARWSLPHALAPFTLQAPSGPGKAVGGHTGGGLAEAYPTLAGDQQETSARRSPFLAGRLNSKPLPARRSFGVS